MSSIVEKVYRSSPFWMKNIVVSLYGFKEYIKTHGKYYDRHYKELIEVLEARTEFWKSEKLI